MLGLTGASIGRRLELACTLVDAVLDATPSFLDELGCPVAVFGSSSTPHQTNAAWRALFGETAVSVLTSSVEATRSTGIDHHDAELQLPRAQPIALAVTLRRRRASGAVIAACIEITDALLAARLGCSTESLMWGGPAGAMADYFSRAWTGWRREPDATKQTWPHAIEPRDLTRVMQAFGETARWRSSVPTEARICRSDGVLRWHRVRFTTDDDGHRWYGVAIDIDDARHHRNEECLADERAARADAERMNALKDQFIAAVSHELRSPVTTLLLWERILRNPASSAMLRSHAIDAIHQSAETQARLVGDLLDVSRGISGKLHIDVAAVDVDVLLADAVDAIAPVAVAKGIAVECHVGELVGAVLGDRIRLRQILDNLLTNAVKFTASSGHIRVTARRDAGMLRIEIADNGRGIAADLLPEIFEPFVQSDDVLTRGGGGLGLGLAISRQLADLHQGTLTVQSAGADQGSTFALTLPCMPSPTIVPVATPRCALTRVRVLLVDDDSRVRDALALLLASAGAVVDTADSAANARVRIAQGAPHALICDLAMPEEDGYSLLRELRASGSTIPAIALTAHATLADVQRARAAGFEAHLAKPVDVTQLIENVDHLVRGIA